MGFGPIDSLIENTVGKVADKLLNFIPDPAKQQEFLMAMRQMDWNELKSQLDINALEAQSSRAFEANARPFILWACGGAFVYKFIASPLLLAFILIFDPHFPTNLLPVLDWSELAPIMMSLLGISYQRSQEKIAIARGR